MTGDLTLLAGLLERIDAKEMPPAEHARQPSDAERKVLLDWLKAQGAAKAASAIAARRILPSDGNYVSHARLFDPATAAAHPHPASPARLWRMNPQGFDLFLKERGVHALQRDDQFSSPFEMIPGAGIKDYAAAYYVDGPTTEQILLAARRLIDIETFYFPEGTEEVREEKALSDGGANTPVYLYPSRKGFRMLPFFAPLFDPAVELTDDVIDTALQGFGNDLLRRPLTDDEVLRHRRLMRAQIQVAGRDEGLRAGLQAMYLKHDLLHRPELGAGDADEHGRRRLAPQELARALTLALDDTGQFAFSAPDRNHKFRPRPVPDEFDAMKVDSFYVAAEKGWLDDREKIGVLIDRYLDEIYKGAASLSGHQASSFGAAGHDRMFFPKMRRFMREYFGYYDAMNVFKEQEDFGGYVAWAMVSDTDLLVDYLVAQDRDVIRQLLSTDKSFVQAGTWRAPEPARFDKNGKEIQPARPATAGASRATEDPEKPILENYRKLMFGKEQFPVEQPVSFPGRRMGMLTQPSWLVAHSHNDSNYAIGRGKWIRERLLGGRVPDIPINVDAKLSNDPTITLRTKMEKTRQEYCWQCHKTMDPLGLPFERFDHYGRWREQELGKPIDTSGAVAHTGVASLEGPVADPFDLIRRLAGSDHVRQVFIRHMFRFWFGRNETLEDAAVLQAADKAYVKSGGSLRAVLRTLLTSDSFLYRKET